MGLAQFSEFDMMMNWLWHWQRWQMAAFAFEIGSAMGRSWTFGIESDEFLVPELLFGSVIVVALLASQGRFPEHLVIGEAAVTAFVVADFVAAAVREVKTETLDQIAAA